MKKLAAQNDKVEFIKQVPLPPRLCLKRKATLNNYKLLYKKKSKSDGDDDVVFIKKVPLRPRDRMKRLLAENDKVEFIKQVPLHPRERLKRATKKQNNVRFIKQVPVHPRGRIKRKEKEIIDKNTNSLLKDEFDFSLMDKIIEKLPQDNDKYYTEHVIDSNKFILSRENKNFEKA